MYTPFPQKYRPRTLSQLTGQEYIQRTLSNAIQANKIAPAYLFTGERGTGKTSTARILAKSLNCTATDQPTVTPCGQCQSCHSIEKGSSLDVMEIDAASHNGVEDARNLIERVHFAPAIGRYRIFVLDEVHCLSSQAFNALLKCLEEPPAHVVFILCTTEAHKVLPTIVSRCQVFRFQPLSVAAIVQHLTIIAEKEAISITSSGKIAIARACGGGLRDALQLLGQLSLLGEEITHSQVLALSGRISESDLVTILHCISTGETLKLLQLSRELLDSGKTPVTLLTCLLSCYRDLLLVANVPDCSSLLTSGVSYSKLRAIAKTWSQSSIHQGFEQLSTSEWQLNKSVQPSLWLEVCLLGLIPKSPKNKPRNHQTHKRNSTSVSSSKPIDLKNTIWETVLSKASEKNRVFLSVAFLAELTEQKATLAVPSPYLNKFNRNIRKVQKLFLAATGINYQVLIQEVNQ
jgi:DNA polymerase III subunit gamma/tau